MSILLSDKSILALPNEMINQIISFLPKHPIAQLMFYHIHYFEGEGGIPFYQEYFNKLRNIKLTYKNGMERALEKYSRKVKQLKFMREIGLDEGMNYTSIRKVWQCENNYDSDNETIYSEDMVYTDSDGETIFDSDNDSDVDNFNINGYY